MRIERRLAALPAWVLPATVLALAVGVRAWTLLDLRAGDPRVRSARVDVERGAFTVPARTAVVFVVE